MRLLSFTFAISRGASAHEHLVKRIECPCGGPTKQASVGQRESAGPVEIVCRPVRSLYLWRTAHDVYKQRPVSIHRNCRFRAFLRIFGKLPVFALVCAETADNVVHS